MRRKSLFEKLKIVYKKRLLYKNICKSENIYYERQLRRVIKIGKE